MFPRGPSNPSRGLGRGRGRGRGGWRGRGGNGRGRGGGIGLNRGKYQAPRIDANEAPLGRLVTEITLDNTPSYGVKTEDAKIRDCRYIASYSLLDATPPKIIIPGQPATWSPPQLPSQLPGDHGDYLRDYNGARFPDYPMQPSVHSLYALDKGFDASTVDIMGCASSLGDILRFVRSVKTTFRFDVEMVGDTLFLVRNYRDQVIPDVRGYGFSFLDSFTSYSPEVQETKSHQRIVSYFFGGLKCIVRFECDGYFAGGQDDLPAEVSEVRGLALSNPIAIKTAGVTIPQKSILEIKTRRSQPGGALVDMDEQLPRLWLRQIPNLISAYHDKGSFEDVQEKSVQQDWLNWEAEHKHELQKFASILHRLIVEVKRAGHLKLELCRTDLGPLELREQSGKPREVLPSDWKDMWAGQQSRGPGRNGEVRLSDGGEGDEDEDDSYPRLPSQKDESDESGASDDDDDFSFDFTACNTSCGYCGKCA